MARRQLVHKKKPLIVICSEGGKKSSEYYYFRNFTNRDLRIQFSTGNNTDPKGMLDDLLKYINNEDIKSEDEVKIFLVLDTDLSEKRINEIKEIEQQCKDNNIEIITSAPTFEIWYLMHYRNNKLTFSSSKDVKREIEKIINEKYIETTNLYKRIYKQTSEAIKTAKKIEEQVLDDYEELIKANPHTSVYIIIDVINGFKNSKKDLQ